MLVRQGKGQSKTANTRTYYETRMRPQIKFFLMGHNVQNLAMQGVGILKDDGKTPRMLYATCVLRVLMRCGTERSVRR